MEKIALSENMTTRVTLNKINEHFAKISNRYEAIKNLHFINLNSSDSLYVSELEVLKSFENLNIRKFNVTGALPAQFLKFAGVHIVPYYTHIINFSFKEMIVPCEWKKRFITPGPKDNNNICIDTLRPITQTNIYSKIMEGFMFNKIQNQILGKTEYQPIWSFKKIFDSVLSGFSV